LISKIGNAKARLILKAPGPKSTELERIDMKRECTSSNWNMPEGHSFIKLSDYFVSVWTPSKSCYKALN
jgi:hypothetical protein